MLGPDSLHETRRALRSYYLGDAASENCAEPFIEAARHFVTDPAAVHASDTQAN